MESKTAMHELLDKFNSTCTLKEFFNHVYNNQQILLAKTNQEIIDAYDAGCKNSGLHKTHEEKATDYFTQKYKQQ
ncbi:MAG: hypothetical protein KA981_12410 [Bacteroidia bacterium]|nr:hypothetical protein [Bacteroidia bacterium]